MDNDMSKEGKGRTNEDVGRQVKPENPIESPRVNGTAPNQEEMAISEESQKTTSEQPQEKEVDDVTGQLE
jgi:hypothetical protein